MTDTGQPAPVTSDPGLRNAIRAETLVDEGDALRRLIDSAALSPAVRDRIGDRAASLVRNIRDHAEPGLMELFLDEFGLSTDEGIALMCLAEALLRVPDDETIDALIEDKIAPSAWGEHLGRSSSPLVNASTWALMLTGAVLRDEDAAGRGFAAALHSVIKRLGEPLIRTAASRAMKELGRQFVLGRDIGEAMERAAGNEARGYTYSYDMLGEAASTEADAQRYHLAYSEAIAAIAGACVHGDIRRNPGISVKLSALHPRYETAQADRVMAELVPRALSLALLAKSAGMGFNIDAEEADRLDLSLDVIEALLADPALAGWDGFGVVVQAYGKRAGPVLDWLYDLAGRLDRRIMCRLVKGAYWDSEIKRAQILGLDGYPVFTRKPSTDVSYIACACKLLGMTDRIYPQFATHNAHTVAAILELAGSDRSAFEFQRLHGMGFALHDIVLGAEGTRCRTYAPVGAHKDLLAYLVRRLLENGANSSFVNQIVDESVPVENVVADPFAAAEAYLSDPANPGIVAPTAIFGPARRNSKGWNLADPRDRHDFDALRAPCRHTVWHAGPLVADLREPGPASAQPCMNPADPADSPGAVVPAAVDEIEAALAAARPWGTVEDFSADRRSAILERAADLYEANSGEIFALLAREAGKTPLDSVGELREAVDFLRYYAAEARAAPDAPPCGRFVCISPWNFPLAIFTGQIAAALVTGNAVIAKPAEQTSLIAYLATRLLHDAGVPRETLQLLPGAGDVVGNALVSDSRIDGVCFTGSTVTAQAINRAMAAHLDPGAPLIAETGGLNAMIVDSTALLEQAVRDIVASAFQSAGQRCSALRMLYVQNDVADDLLDMLLGTLSTLRIGDPWEFSTDIGPVIDAAAHAKISAHIAAASRDERLLGELDAPGGGLFVGPAVIGVSGIGDLTEEIFGPVLHVATFDGADIDRVIDDVNRSGYGLTFGLHTRIDGRVQRTVDRVRAGNIYVNRNQIGAVVGSQPFGGEGLSGTGPKAGGPHYLQRFRSVEGPPPPAPGEGQTPATITSAAVATALAVLPSPDAAARVVYDLPGPTGESNRLSLFPRGVVLCLGPMAAAAARQRDICRDAGCAGLAIAPGLEDGLDGVLTPAALSDLGGIDAVVYWGDGDSARALRRALAARPGPLIPLIREREFAHRLSIERHVCVDTTASGGNASLLAAGAEGSDAG